MPGRQLAESAMLMPDKLKPGLIKLGDLGLPVPCMADRRLGERKNEFEPVTSTDGVPPLSLSEDADRIAPADSHFISLLTSRCRKMHDRKHQRDWQELEQLIKKAEKRRTLRKMSPEMLSRLDILYRRTSIQLARIKGKSRDLHLVNYLNSLVASAHSIIYIREKQSSVPGILLLFTEKFPGTVMKGWAYHAVSALFLISGFMVGYLAMKLDSTAAYALLPAGEFRQPGVAPEQLAEMLRYGRDMGHGGKFFFASFLLTHNIKVGLLSLATGILAGIIPVLLMFYNGIVLGAFSGIHHSAGIYLEYWAWILPHGITEICAIVLCGGAGIRIGHAVVAPGLTPRMEKIKEAGKDLVVLVSGTVVMLFTAAVIESFLRQSQISWKARIIFALSTALFWLAYFTYGGWLALRDRKIRKGSTA